MHYFGRAFIIYGTCVEIKRRITVCRTVAGIAHSAYSFHLRLAVEIIYRYTDKLRRIAVIIIAVFVIYVCLRYKISVGRHCAYKFVLCLKCDLAVLSDKSCFAVLSRQISHIAVFHRLNIILSSQQYVHIPVITGVCSVIVFHYGISVICAYLRSVFVFSEQICIAVIKIILVIVKAKNSVAVCLYIRICTYINAVACAYGIDGVHIRFIDNIVIVNFFVYVRFGDEIITDKVGIINCIKCSSVPFVDYRIIVFFISVTNVFDIQQITEIRYVHRCLRVYVNRRHKAIVIY